MFLYVIMQKSERRLGKVSFVSFFVFKREGSLIMFWVLKCNDWLDNINNILLHKSRLNIKQTKKHIWNDYVILI